MGPLMDCLAVADEVRKLGHKVGFLCRDRFYKIAKTEGYSVYPVISPKAPRRINRLFDLDFPFFQGLNDEVLVKKTIQNELVAIQKFKPDVIFTWLQFTAYISAKTTDTPIASVARWTGHSGFTSDLLDGGHFPVSRCTPLFNYFLEKFDLPKIDDIWELDFVRSDLKVVPGIPDLEPGFRKEKNLHYVGYLSYKSAGKMNKLPQQLKDWLTSSPSVFVYLSAKQFQPKNYVPILQQAFDDSGFRVIVAVGLKDICPQLPKNTESVRFERLLPIDVVLPHVDILISTGTRGISWQAALNGVAHLSIQFCSP